MRMVQGQKIECDCGKCRVDRNGDTYSVKGPIYHHRDNASEWLICSKCDDKIQINPVVSYIDAPETKGLR